MEKFKIIQLINKAEDKVNSTMLSNIRKTEINLILLEIKKQLTLTSVGCTLPSKKELMLFANKYTNKEMPQFTESDKICFRAGVLNCHTWLEEGKIK